MYDGRALQMATSHRISQSFAQAFDMQYQTRNGDMAYPFLTSWGTTTRLIGAIVMMHGDQKGIVLPPFLAPIQVVIIPIVKKGYEELVQNTAHQIYHTLTSHIRVTCDDDTAYHPGYKFHKWELKGVPLRIEVGPKDVEHQHVIVTDRLHTTRQAVSISHLTSTIYQQLCQFHTALYQRAQERVRQQWYQAEKLNTFGPDIVAYNGAYQTGWCGSDACENALKEYQATIRCTLSEATYATCFNCSQSSQHDVLVAKAY